MCVDVNVLAKKYSIPAKKLLIIASLSGAYIEGEKVCGDIDEVLIKKYKEIENRINNDEIVEIDNELMADLFREYNIIKAYGTLFVTRRIPVSSDILAKFPCIRRTAVILGNIYYITPAQYLKLKILMQKEKERVETIVIDVDNE